MGCRGETSESQPTLPPLEHSAGVTWADFDRTGGRIVTASRDGKVRIWDAKTGELRCLLQGPKDMAGRATAALSPDGSTLAATFSQPHAHLWMVDPMVCASGEPDGERRVVDTYAEVYAKVADARARLRRLPQELQKLRPEKRKEYGLQ